MFKVISLLTLLLFLVATTLAPYMLSQQAQVMTGNTEERAFSNNNFEEEIHHERVSTLIIVPSLLSKIPFPRHDDLEPQHILLPAIKPPPA